MWRLFQQKKMRYPRYKHLEIESQTELVGEEIKTIKP